MRKFRPALAIVLLFSLVACGEEPASTPAPSPTAAPATVAATVAPIRSATTAAIAPFIATITAGSLPTSAGGTATPASTLARATATVAAPASNLPVYSGLTPVDLGPIGSQITGVLSQASTTARSTVYYTSDTFDKLAGYYNLEIPKLGYTRVAEQALPASAGLNGSLILYSKGSGIAAEVLAVMNIGPLDEAFVSTLSAVSSSAAKLKTGDSLVIVLSGLTGKNLLELQSILGAGGATTPGATPTR